jgi:pimeloyl-ACP methyl ester carboxylesterase
MTTSRGLAAGARLFAVLVVTAIVASGCGDDGSSEGRGFLETLRDGIPATSETTTPETTTPEGSNPETSDAGPGTIGWTRSGSLDLGRLEVPLDHDDPQAGTVELAIARRPAGDPERRIGVLFVNPGGPGASGIEIAGFFGFLFSRELLDRFDVVTWDPRGVGQSTQVICGDGEFMDRYVAADPVPQTPRAEAEVDALVREFAARCEADTGWLLPHLHTEASARDMDRIRAALREDQISYLGFSYGTFLGATYAELFPERIRALVLDGAYSRSVSMADMGEGQARGFEGALDSWFAWCRRTRCTFDTGGDLGVQFDRLMESIRTQPLAADDADGRHLTAGLAWTGVLAAMYSPELWSQLDRGLSGARDGDGRGLMLLADYYNERSTGGVYTTLHYAFTAYTCMDNPTPTPTEEREAIERTLAAAPRVGPVFVSIPSPCEHWPVPSRGTTDPFSITGTPPVLVIATTGDPATPYQWGVQLADELESAVLLTVEGDGHTAFGSGNRCVDQAVAAYLVDLEVPAGEARCAA